VDSVYSKAGSPREMSREELAWVAGLLEGEGSFTLQKTKYKGKVRYIQPRIQVYMTDEDIIHRLRSITGVGYIYGPVYRSGDDGRGSRMEDWSPQYQWIVQRKAHAYWLLYKLLPHMGIRRSAQIRLLLDDKPLQLFSPTEP
jgi:hypothetical protein